MRDDFELLQLEAHVLHITHVGLSALFVYKTISDVSKAEYEQL